MYTGKLLVLAITRPTQLRGHQLNHTRRSNASGLGVNECKASATGKHINRGLCEFVTNRKQNLGLNKWMTMCKALAYRAIKKQYKYTYNFLKNRVNIALFPHLSNFNKNAMMVLGVFFSSFLSFLFLFVDRRTVSRSSKLCNTKATGSVRVGQMMCDIRAEVGHSLLAAGFFHTREML
jgi:hypothetical protein